MHHSLSPFKVGLIIDANAEQITEMQMNQLNQLGQLLMQQLHKSKISVLPFTAQWSVNQCDARALPFVVFLEENTLESGICSLRSQDTSLKVLNLIERL